jgi:hypothetical protein
VFETDSTLFKSEQKQIMMRKNKILIVDDQEEIFGKMILKKHFEEIFTTNDPKNNYNS